MTDTTDRPAWCYRFRFSDEMPVYIGVTTDLPKRLKDHRNNWFIDAPMEIDVMQVPFKDRFRYETALIRRYRPIENSFIAKNDNEFFDIVESWKHIATIYPNKRNRFGKIVFHVEERKTE